MGRLMVSGGANDAADAYGIIHQPACFANSRAASRLGVSYSMLLLRPSRLRAAVTIYAAATGG